MIKSYEKKKRMFGLRKNGENVEEREEGKMVWWAVGMENEGKYCGFLRWRQ